MERNQIIGFILIFVILMVWSIFNKPPELEEVVPQDSEVLTESPVEAPSTSQGQVITPDSIPQEALEVLKNQFAIFASQAAGQEEIFTLENDLIQISFSNKGGRIIQAELQDYYKLVEVDGEERKEKVRLFEDEKNRFNYALNAGGRLINTEDLYFVGTSNNNTLEFRLNAESGGYFLQRYSLSPDSYQLDYSIQFHGLNNDLQTTNGTVDLQVDNYLDRIEQNTMFEKRYSTVYYREVDEDSDYCSCTSSDTDDRTGRKIQWVSFVNQFFNTSIMSPSKPFDGAVISTDFLSDDTEDLK
ncbi:MAG: membrane protein insertase YidC, partial [Candidatus Kariarchaeaceae archaeon]